MRTSKARQFDLLAHLAYRESSQYTTRMTSLDSVMLQTRYATGDVVYLPPASYEFTIFHNETEEIVYSQRYEPGDRDEAEDFCRQFIDVLVSQRSAKKTSALVVCVSGYTAYLFAQRLGALAEREGLDCAFSSGVVGNARNVEQQYDVILLAPQVGYQLDRVQLMLPGKPVVVIPTDVFARRDLAACMRLVTSAIERADQNGIGGWYL